MSLYRTVTVGPYLQIISKVIETNTKRVCSKEHKHVVSGGPFCPKCGAPITDVETNYESVPHTGSLVDWGIDPDRLCGLVYPEDSGIFVANNHGYDNNVNADEGGSFEITPERIKRELEHFKKGYAPELKMLDDHAVEYIVKYGTIVSLS